LYNEKHDASKSPFIQETINFNWISLAPLGRFGKLGESALVYKLSFG